MQIGATMDLRPALPLALALLSVRPALASTSPIDVSEPPFGNHDWSWLNGSNSQPSSLLGMGPLTWSVYVDAYLAEQLSNPIDQTIFPTTDAPRSNEFSLNLVSVGVDVTGLDGPIGRLYLQYGSNVETVAGQDLTTQRGFYLTQRAFMPIQQAAAGWHFHWLHGLNIEAGIFPSYIGIESYLPEENWNYSHSLLSDFTPYYFSGLRTQIFPSQNLKIEIWVVNGWQTFGQWEEAKSVGYLLNWRPRGWISLSHSSFAGQEVPLDPGSLRLYSDNSAQVEYLHGSHPGQIKSAAFCLVGDVGYEKRGDAPSGPMGGGSLSHRIAWNDRWATALRADIFYDQTQALVIQLPQGSPYSLPNKGPFLGGGLTATQDFWPSPWLLVRLEYAHRAANIPYFSGRGGITGPNGLPAANPADFTPDLRNTDDRFILDVTLRL